MEHLINNNSEIEFNEEEFKDCIKYRCGMCGRSINNNWKLYQVKGNYCQDCSNKVSRLVDIKLKQRQNGKSKSQNKTESI